MQWRHVPPDRFDYADRHPLVLAVVGMIFLLIVAGVCWFASHAPAAPAVPSAALPAPLGAMAVVSVFLVAGLALAFGSWGFRIDRGMQSLTRWWNLILPVCRRRYSLTQFSCIGVSWIPGPDDSSESLFGVTLGGSGKSVRLACLRDLRDARALARDLAEFLRLPVHDETLGRIEL